MVFPVLLAAVSAGLGLLLERALRVRIERSLVVPCGFALLVLVTTLATSNAWSADLTTPLAVVLAAAGIVLGVRGRDWSFSRLGTAAVLGVFAVAAAPVVLSGKATFAGYTQLDDISTLLALATHVVEHGREVSLPPSTAEATLDGYLGDGYPLGSFVPLTTLQPLVGTDSAWLWQPYLSFVLAVLASSLWALAAPLVRDARLRALVVFLAAQPALLYAYALQGGVKELAAAALAAVAAALAAAVIRDTERVRLAVPLGVAGAGLACVLNVGFLAYVGALGAVAIALAILFNARDRIALGRLARSGSVAAVAIAVLAVPVVSVAASTASASSGLLQNQTDLGNLFGALDWRQIFGIWPTGDFRLGLPDGRGIAGVLIAVLAVAAAGGAVTALRERAAGPLVFAGCVGGAAIGFAIVGNSPWVDAKALAIASPALVLLAATGACVLLGTPARAVGAIALAAIGAGVLWSNWLAYRDVRLAPRDRLAELERIGERFAGEGPTLINEYEPYGARYFLRATDPEAPAELRRRVVPLRRGTDLEKLEWAPVDEFQPAATLEYRTIVLRRSPAESRPLPQYELRESGRYYDVWQRPERPSGRVVEQAMFGDRTVAAVRPPCAEVRRLARAVRGQGARLVAAERPQPVIADLSAAGPPPPGWTAAPGPSARLFPDREGSVRLPVSVPAAGEFDVWVQGSFGHGLEIAIDGARVGSVRDHPNFEGLWNRFGRARLAAGEHEVELRYGGLNLRPGSDAPQRLGPVALVPRNPAPRVTDVSPRTAERLCSRSLDWLAVLAR